MHPITRSLPGVGIILVGIFISYPSDKIYMVLMDWTYSGDIFYVHE